MYNVTNEDLDILSQKTKELKIQLQILNDQFQPIDVLQYDLISGSYSCDASSDIRRTLSLVLHVKDKSYLVSESSKIWFNKYIKVYIGIKQIRTQEILYYPMGLYVFSEQSYQYDATTNSLTLKLLDIMSLLTNVRNGAVGALTTTIPVNSNIRDAMISAISQLDTIQKYLIGNVGNGTNITVPYDLTFNSGCTVYDIVAKLRDLYIGWEIFFDEDMFVCQKVPMCIDDPIVLDYQTIIDKQLLISEQRSNKFEEVKNVMLVYGKQITTDRYTETCTISGSQYNATFTDLTALESGIIYAVKLPSQNLSNATLKINSFTTYPITDASEIVLDVGVINGYSAFKFKDSKFLYLGQYQVSGLAMLVSVLPNTTQQNAYKTKYNCSNVQFVVNADSPYTVDKIGEILEVKSGSDFENIYANDLALQRAVYELWKTSRLTDSIVLEFQNVFWLGVNQKISYQSKVTGEINQYIIKSISMSLLDGKMTVNAMTFYPTYETDL